MRSIIKSSPKARNSSAFSVEIFLKMLFAASLNFRLFLAKQHLKKDFHKRFLAKQPPKIHGTHGEHGFSLKILLKIFVKMSSRRRSPIKSSPEATYCCAFSVEIFVKDSCGMTKTCPSALRPQPSALSPQTSALSPQTSPPVWHS